jgi:hypothetical protein
MAKLKVKNLKQVQTSLRMKIRKELRKKDVSKGVAEIVVGEIQDGDFGRPSDSYYDWRETNDSRNKTHKKYDRDKINITFTGELLKDLIKNVKASFSGSKSEYVLEHSDGMHKAYKTSKGKTKRSTYKKISEGVQRYYPYLTFSDKTQSKVIKFIRKEVISKLSKK